MNDYLVRPDPTDARLTSRVTGIDHDGKPVETSVTVERPLTLYVNSQEVVTLMTVGDHVESLAVGYLINQNMLKPADEITGVDYDQEIDTVVVRTAEETNFDERLKKRTRTSGCATGTAFGDPIARCVVGTTHPHARVRPSWHTSLAFH